MGPTARVIGILSVEGKSMTLRWVGSTLERKCAMAHQDADNKDFSASENGRTSTESFASSARDEALSAAEKGLEAAREALAAAERKLAEAQRQAAYDRARQQTGQEPIDVDPVACDAPGAGAQPHGAPSGQAQSAAQPQTGPQPAPDPASTGAGAQQGPVQGGPAWSAGQTGAYAGTQAQPHSAHAQPASDPSRQGGYASNAQAGGYNTSAASQQNTYQQSYAYQQPHVQPHYTAPVASRDHVAAGLLALFLGPFGVHKFYLGYNTQGFILLAISLLGGLFSFGLVTGIVWVISIVEGIIYLTKAQSEFERIYVYDKREWF